VVSCSASSDQKEEDGCKCHKDEYQECRLHEEPFGKDSDDRIDSWVEDPIVVAEGDFMKDHKRS